MEKKTETKEDAEIKEIINTQIIVDEIIVANSDAIKNLIKISYFCEYFDMSTHLTEYDTQYKIDFPLSTFEYHYHSSTGTCFNVQS